MEGRALVGWRLQVAIVLVAGGLWSVYPKATFGALVVAYLAGWLLINVVGSSRVRLESRVALALAFVLAAAPLARVWQHWRHFAENEAFVGLSHLTESHMALAETPSIFPRLFSTAQPNIFYVHAPDAARVHVTFGDGSEEHDAQALGHGLFRLVVTREVSPIDATPVIDASEPTLEAVIHEDGEETARRTLQVSRPLAHPRWLAASPDRTRAAAVSEETNELFVVEADAPPRQLDVFGGPVGVVFVSEDEVAMAHRYGATVHFRSLAPEGAGREVEIGPGATGIAISPDRERVVVAREGLDPELVVLSSRYEVLARIALDFQPEWVAYGADASTIVVSERRPARLHRFVDGAPAGEPLQLGRPAVTMTARGPRLVVAVTDYRPDGQEHLGNHFALDTLVTVDLNAWRVIDARPTATRSERQRSPGNVDRGVSPMGIDLAPDGSTWVAFAGTDDVFHYRPGAAQPRVMGLEDHPLAAPSSIVALAGGRLAISSPVYGTIGLFDSNGERIAIARFAPGDQDLLRDDEEALKRRIGERTFYESTRSGISCQTCHLHGGSDGARHNIGGTTFVATLDSRGAAGTPPYLRDGGYPTLGSLDDVAQTLYRGYRRIQGGRRPGLNAYLEALPRQLPITYGHPRDAEREARGLDAFVSARCVLCHAFPAFTNLSQHTAEWLFPGSDAAAHELDTPSLIGVGRSAPYLVDGRAETIEAVLRDHDPAQRHGNLDALDDDAVADLVYLLEGL